MKDGAEKAYQIGLKRINERIEELGLSRYKLAKLSGLEESTIKRVLEGASVPSVTTFLQIIGALGGSLILDITGAAVEAKRSGRDLLISPPVAD